MVAQKKNFRALSCSEIKQSSGFLFNQFEFNRNNIDKGNLVIQIKEFIFRPKISNKSRKNSRGLSEF